MGKYKLSAPTVQAYNTRQNGARAKTTGTFWWNRGDGDGFIVLVSYPYSV